MGLNEEICSALLSLQDLSYRKFQSSLIPTVAEKRMIGVRMPELRKLAKRIIDRDDLKDFLGDLPHAYHEENNLHAYIIGYMSRYDQCIVEIKRFLPYVDNWSTCDSMRPKCFKNHLDELLQEIKIWLLSPEPYTVRFALEMLMIWFLDAKFEPVYLEWGAAVQSEEYYVKMMQAWFFATALAKQYETAVSYLKENRLELWVHNKAIQKAIESYRISPEQKVSLCAIKRKI